MIAAAPAGREPGHNNGNGAEPTIRYTVVGWFEEHAGDEVRAYYDGALDLVGNVCAFKNVWHGIGLRLGPSAKDAVVPFAGSPYPFAHVSLRVVEDVSV